jgi:phosphoribosylamine---glycine ligase
MVFNFISDDGDGSGIALRCADEDNDVRLWIRNKKCKEIADGLVEKVGDLEDLIKDASPDNDVFVFDGSGNGTVADSLRKDGFGVIGGSMAADMLERDRSFGLSVMEQAGIDSPPTHRFTSFADGIAFAKQSKERLVYKPSKHLGDESPSLVSSDSEELIETLTRIEKETGISDPEFELQEFIEGAELSTECWFDGTSFIEPMWNHTFERKQLMNENIGPSGGCSGNVVWSCGDCPICNVVRGMGDFLRTRRFVGPIDINCIASGGRVYGLEFTPRFGYDATPTLLWELLDGETSQLLHDVARGQYNQPSHQSGLFVRRYSSPGLRDGIAGGLRITIPPYPSEKYEAASGVPIGGLPKGYQDFTCLYDVKMVEDKLQSAGSYGILLLFTGHGDTVGKALSHPQRMAEQVRIPDKQYRTDLVMEFKEDFEKLSIELGITVNI